MSKSTLLPLVLLLSLGCGSDDDGTSAGADADITPSADADLTQPDAAVEDPDVFAYVLGTDSATSGILTQIALEDLGVRQGIVDGIVSNDAVARRFGNRLYIVNRLGADNVTIVDLETEQLVAQISTGAGTNPQDVALIGDSLYVCAYESGSIIVLDQSDATAEPSLIDISSYDKDGIPNCASIVESGGMLYATLGIIDNEFTSNGGEVVVIDPSNNSIATDFSLVNNNPFGLIEVSADDSAFGGDLLVGTTDFGPNGCIERITPGAAPTSAGCLITNAELGGYVSKLQIQGDSAVAAVSTSFTESKLVRIAEDGTLTEASITPATQHVTDIAVCPSGDILTNDLNTGTIRVYDESDEQRGDAGGIDLGLPPVFTNGIVCF